MGGAVRRIQTASLVLDYSRMILMQMYPRFTRFQCKLFLTEAFRYFDGVCGRCVIDARPIVSTSGAGSSGQTPIGLILPPDVAESSESETVHPV